MKGNKPFIHYPACTIEDGLIIKELPLVPYDDSHVHLFSVISPIKCRMCGQPLKSNTKDSRVIISTFEVLKIPVTYWVCSDKRCKKSHPDHIVGVNGGDNYSIEYKEKSRNTRYKGKCSLHNTNIVGHIFTKDTGHMGRSPCATTIWIYEQKQGELSLNKLRETDVGLSEKIYVDGIFIKAGWKKNVEIMLNRKISQKGWRRLRYKVVYVVATEEKVILDFQIANRQPSFFELIPLFSRLKVRFGENVKTIVSDEEWAIIDAAKSVFPDANFLFCVFHQLQKIDIKFFGVYQDKAHIPDIDQKFNKLFKKLILSESVIESSAFTSMINELMGKSKVSEVVQDTYKYVMKKYLSNRELFEKNIMPETNNTMEQIFSTIKDFVIQCRSFKIVEGLKNWAANLFYMKNSAPFKTGNNRGKSPLEINAAKRGVGV